MKKIIVQITFFVLSISITQAHPIKVGVEGGLSAALGKLSYNSGISLNKVTSIGPRFGARFGLPIQFQLNNNLLINSGFYFAQKGISKNDNNFVGLVYNSIELPLAFVYRSNKTDNKNYFIGLGGYVGYAISGKIHSYYVNGQPATENISFGNTILVHDMRRFDYGLHFQTGWSFKNGLFLRLVAQRQLNNMAIKNNGFAFNEIKNQAYVAFSMAYLF